MQIIEQICLFQLDCSNIGEFEATPKLVNCYPSNGKLGDYFGEFCFIDTSSLNNAMNKCVHLQIHNTNDKEKKYLFLPIDEHRIATVRFLLSNLGSK
jgi:hypothetical protein